MATNYTAVTTATNENIILGMFRKGISKNATATKAGIPNSTFNRKLSNTGDFTLRELGKIAEALDLELADILPADLIAREAA